MANLTMARINYLWRLLATGFCFTVFGLGGLVLSTFVFPLLLLTSCQTRALRARWLIHMSFRAFMWLMEAIGVFRLEVAGSEQLKTCHHALVVANHPTLIDVVALISQMPTATCIVKRALWDNPFLGGVVRAANYISNSEAEGMIDDCAREISAGRPLIVFPEGSRTEPEEPLHFLRGAAHIALKADLSILPVLIFCTPTTLTKREKWYQIPDRRFSLRLKVLAPLQASHLLPAGDENVMSARQLTRSLEAFFTRELQSNGIYASPNT